MQPAKAAMAKVNRVAPATMVIMADLLSVRRGNLFRRPAFVRNNFDETTMTAPTYHPLARPLQKCRFQGAALPYQPGTIKPRSAAKSLTVPI